MTPPGYFKIHVWRFVRPELEPFGQQRGMGLARGNAPGTIPKHLCRPEGAEGLRRPFRAHPAVGGIANQGDALG